MAVLRTPLYRRIGARGKPASQGCRCSDRKVDTGWIQTSSWSLQCATRWSSPSNKRRARLHVHQNSPSRNAIPTGFSLPRVLGAGNYINGPLIIG
ncbi:hypothetical protein ANTQUA_LOCUS6807 [Anthophora quadrimaculata]